MADTADAGLIDRLVARQSTAFAAECAQVLDMLVFVADARSQGEAIGGRQAGQLEAESAVHELSLALLVPVGTLQRVLAAARYARTRLPQVWDEWTRGRLGAAHVGLIVATAGRFERPDSIIRLDATVVDTASTRTLEQLRRWLARFVDRIEPDLAEQRHRQARRERRVHLEVGDDGMSWLMALLPSTEAAAIDHRIEQAARKNPTESRTDSQRTHSQRRADALSALLLGDRSNTATTNSARIDIGVVVPIQSVMGLSDAPGELIDRSASVPASYIRDLAVQPGTLFWRLLTDQSGKLLDVSRLGRFATGDLGMAIRFRDGTSVFPTSTVPANDCDTDHTIAYPAPTTGANLGALHRRAHRLKTAGTLSVKQTEPGTFDWTTSTGHHYQRSPDPLPAQPWHPDPWFTAEFITHTEHDIALGIVA